MIELKYTPIIYCDTGLAVPVATKRVTFKLKFSEIK